MKACGKQLVAWGALAELLRHPSWAPGAALVVVGPGRLRWWLTRLTEFFPEGRWSEMTSTYTLPSGRAVKFEILEG